MIVKVWAYNSIPSTLQIRSVYQTVTRETENCHFVGTANLGYLEAIECNIKGKEKKNEHVL